MFHLLFNYFLIFSLVLVLMSISKQTELKHLAVVTKYKVIKPDASSNIDGPLNCSTFL